MGTLTSIFDFFRRILSGRRPADRASAIKGLFTSLSSHKPPYFKAAHNSVLPGFAENLLRFQRLITPFSDFINATISHPHSLVAHSYLDYLVEALLPHELLVDKDNFCYEGILVRVRDAKDPKAELGFLEEDFYRFLDALADVNSQVIDNSIAELDKFSDLCRWDYEKLLGYFDPGINIYDPQCIPVFGPVSGEQLISELSDFYLMTDDFAVNQTLKELLHLLLKARRSPLADEEGMQRISTRLDKVAAMLKNDLSPGILLSLIRAIMADPDFNLSMPMKAPSFFGDYKRRFIRRFERDRLHYLQERQDAEIEKDIPMLFGGEALSDLEGYNSETDAVLQSITPFRFSRITAIRILKTFAKRVVDTHLKEMIKRILVDGYFDNKAFQNNLANLLYKCERSSTRIIEFEESLNGKGRASISGLFSQIEEMKRGKDLLGSIETLVAMMNEKAEKLVVEEKELYSMLAMSLGEIVADFRRRTPEIVTNIRTFGSGKNKDILGHLLNGWEKTRQLVKILESATFRGAMSFQLLGLGIDDNERAAGAVGGARQASAEASGAV